MRKWRKGRLAIPSAAIREQGGMPVLPYFRRHGLSDLVSYRKKRTDGGANFFVLGARTTMSNLAKQTDRDPFAGCALRPAPVRICHLFLALIMISSLLIAMIDLACAEIAQPAAPLHAKEQKTVNFRSSKFRPHPKPRKKNHKRIKPASPARGCRQGGKWYPENALYPPQKPGMMTFSAVVYICRHGKWILAR